jgi:hypothetical protein
MTSWELLFSALGHLGCPACPEWDLLAWFQVLGTMQDRVLFQSPDSLDLSNLPQNSVLQPVLWQGLGTEENLSVQSWCLLFQQTVPFPRSSLVMAHKSGSLSPNGRLNKCFIWQQPSDVHSIVISILLGSRCSLSCLMSLDKKVAEPRFNPSLPGSGTLTIRHYIEQRT